MMAIKNTAPLILQSTIMADLHITDFCQDFGVVSKVFWHRGDFKNRNFLIIQTKIKIVILTCLKTHQIQ